MQLLYAYLCVYTCSVILCSGVLLLNAFDVGIHSDTSRGPSISFAESLVHVCTLHEKHAYVSTKMLTELRFIKNILKKS